jgi:hypothetical protein
MTRRTVSVCEASEHRNWLSFISPETDYLSQTPRKGASPIVWDTYTVVRKLEVCRTHFVKNLFGSRGISKKKTRLFNLKARWPSG